MNFTKPTTRALALSAAALLLLAGCGNADDEAVDPVDTTQAPPADDEPENGTGDAAGTDDVDGTDGATEDVTDDATGDTTGDEAENGDDTDSPDAAGEHTELLAAIDLAEAEADGTAFGIDDEDGGNWEITVAAGDEEIEVLVSGDGTEVLGTDNEGSLDSDDRAGLDAADVTISEAIETAAGEHTGSIDDVELDDEDGTFAWEVNFTDDVEIYVHVTNGDILKVERD